MHGIFLLSTSQIFFSWLVPVGNREKHKTGNEEVMTSVFKSQKTWKQIFHFNLIYAVNEGLDLAKSETANSSVSLPLRNNLFSSIWCLFCQKGSLGSLFPCKGTRARSRIPPLVLVALLATESFGDLCLWEQPCYLLGDRATLSCLFWHYITLPYITLRRSRNKLNSRLCSLTIPLLDLFQFVITRLDYCAQQGPGSLVSGSMLFPPAMAYPTSKASCALMSLVALAVSH